MTYGKRFTQCIIKNAPKKNVKATLPVDPLIKQGSVYRDEETKKLPLYAKILKVSPWKAVLAIRSKYSMSVCFI